jgi:hypothetical protein
MGTAFAARGLRLIARQERNNGPAMPPAFAACPSITKRGGRIITVIRSICRIAWQADDSYPLSANMELGYRSIKKKLPTCSELRKGVKILALNEGEILIQRATPILQFWITLQVAAI